jgi:hypothetical protein
MDRKPMGYWTHERMAEEAAKHQTLEEFRTKCRSAYTRAQKLGLLDELCAHMKKGYTKHNRVLQNARGVVKVDVSTKSCPDAVMLVDSNDWTRLSELQEQGHLGRFHAVASSSRTCVKVNVPGRSPLAPNGCTTVVFLHRIIVEAGPEGRVGHHDGDGLNNRRGNLWHHGQ